MSACCGRDFDFALTRTISSAGANSYHATLLKDFFCDGEMVAGKVPTIVDRMKRKKPLK